MLCNRVFVAFAAVVTAAFLAVGLAGFALAPAPADEAAAAAHPSAGLMRAIEAMARETFACGCRSIDGPALTLP